VSGAGFFGTFLYRMDGTVFLDTSGGMGLIKFMIKSDLPEKERGFPPAGPGEETLFKEIE
jgi:hypothetical protein